MELLSLGLEKANGGDRVGWGLPGRISATGREEGRTPWSRKAGVELEQSKIWARWERREEPSGAVVELGESSPARPTRPVNSPVLHLPSRAGAAWGPEQRGGVTDRADPGEAEVQPPGRGGVGGLAVPPAA
ncbi:unnamed protein product [Rangifer tarandus platyrhynchus]|uniref:Uncharacterized protein n=2 Tax=Rangifer tarandus platyrhynchus TaxID=3082113 RepID=A0ABN8Y247_RANTA|nr:unnamed protein product [Rangifer tarandus platyrhynchus]CAI9692654.1 unnamed protein product [Rangifer tarandus platyrhynchus]